MVWFIVASLKKMIGRLAMTKVAAIIPTLYTTMFEQVPLECFGARQITVLGEEHFRKEKVRMGRGLLFPPLVERA